MKSLCVILFATFAIATPVAEASTRTDARNVSTVLAYQSAMPGTIAQMSCKLHECRVRLDFQGFYGGFGSRWVTGTTHVYTVPWTRSWICAAWTGNLPFESTCVRTEQWWTTPIQIHSLS